jgi:flagellar protein FlaJ
MALTRMHWVGIISGAIILIINVVLFIVGRDLNLFLFLFGIIFGVVIFPFIIGLTLESKKGQKIGEMFLEFSRNLAEGVATGTPISKSIINMSGKDYGPLTSHVRKLANQISIGIPVNTAMRTFARGLRNPVISRAVGLISEAERAGGEIGNILESTAKSIAEVEKLKAERKAAIFNLIVQGYIIFFIFIGIMLVMEFKIIPLTSGLAGFEGLGGSPLGIEQDVGITQTAFSPEALSRPFLYLLLTQGFFAGLTIGKLSEGSVKKGIKHSFILVIAAFLVSTGARAFLGG